jgi:hypothetical protein
MEEASTLTAGSGLMPKPGRYRSDAVTLGAHALSDAPMPIAAAVQNSLCSIRYSHCSYTGVAKITVRREPGKRGPMQGVRSALEKAWIRIA